MKKNPKKVITHCPVQKEKGGIVKSECPAIGNVRSIRKRLNNLEKTGDANLETLDNLRDRLKEAKTEDVKEKFCSSCHHKK